MANDFLSRVDAKLQEAADHSRKDSVLSDSSEDLHSRNGHVTAPREQKQEDKEEKDFDGPRLRMRHSTNFGSAFGSGMPGRMRGG